jgi:hypothetical protein
MSESFRCDLGNYHPRLTVADNPIGKNIKDCQRIKVKLSESEFPEF